MEATPNPTIPAAFEQYRRSSDHHPLFFLGDAEQLLAKLPDEALDCCLTSPPYWGQRNYNADGIGLEADYRDYVEKLLAIFAQLKRVLKTTGSFWLNLGDAYLKKNLIGLPWRVALALTDRQGWMLRNSIVWNKVKGGPDNANDKLRNVHEMLFHFVKVPKGYYYEVDAARRRAPARPASSMARSCPRRASAASAIGGSSNYRREGKPGHSKF